MAKTIRVLVVEDNRLARDGLAALLGAQRDFQIVAAAEGVDAGLRGLCETKPHVVLVGASLGHRSSYPFVERVRTTAPEVRVVVMDVFPLEEDVVAFVRAGAAGLVAKRASSDDLVATVRSVAGDAKVVPPPLTRALFSYIANGSVGRSGRAASGVARMSKREREIVDLIAQGLSNNEIARRLHIATDTVKSHVHTILEKLALRNRVQIAAYVLRAGGSKPESPSPSRRPPRPRPNGAGFWPGV